MLNDIESAPATKVVTLDLSDLGADGEQHPLSQAVDRVVLAAGCVVASPIDRVGAHASLESLAVMLESGFSEIPESSLPSVAEYVRAMQWLLLTMHSVVHEED